MDIKNDDLLKTIKSFADRKILIIGEAILDCYLHGTTGGLCGEAPVPVIKINNNSCIPGGAANIAVNFAGLKSKIVFLSVTGSDYESTILLQSLTENGIPIDNVIRVTGRRTLTRQRLYAGSQMIARFDQGSTSEIDKAAETKIIESLISHFKDCNAMVISDHNYGIITRSIIEIIKELQQKDPHFIVADSCRPEEFPGTGIIPINPDFSEINGLLWSKKIQNNIRQQSYLEKEYSEQVKPDYKKVFFFPREEMTQSKTRARNYRSSGAENICDTYISIFAASLAAGANFKQAEELSSKAVSVIVKGGISLSFIDEMSDCFSKQNKLISGESQLIQRLSGYRRTGSRIVFTNGCFDILHSGHIALLNRAKDFGDVLIVGLNSDSSITRLKGPGRPVNTFDDRAQVLSAIDCVNYIISFNDETPANLIKTICPDVFVKGGNYTFESLPEAGLVLSLGGKIEILPYIADHSTEGTIKKIHQMQSAINYKTTKTASFITTRYDYKIKGNEEERA